ncbi:hypothetical protein JIN77_15590 [Verrucomicrobiaceae bacterium R5-34]|nr:hypothetical protein [Verrucomicrobiaceae bacterium R5-34]
MSDTSTPKLVNLTLRDGQQSTLDAADWVFEPRDFAKIIAASAKAGFHGAEIAGGQSFQIAISRGYNPFTILGAVSHALSESEDMQDFELQMLFRGANALGFRHYDKDVLEITLNEFIKNGITKIRFFDALNDIENLELPESVKAAEGVVLEGAICFTHYPEAPERYSDEYFCHYAQALIDAGYNAIAIKDMSGQLTDDRISTLLPALMKVLEPGDITLTLHCHSTNTENSSAAIARAIEFGVDVIETAEGCLAGGSSHHALSAVAPQLISDQDSYDKLGNRINQIWGEMPDRKDQEIPQELKEQLCAAGVPGGAMPFVIRDLQQQESTIRAKYLSSPKATDKTLDLEEFSTIVDLFIAELKRVCQDAALPLLVTPTADICCKQAIANLAIGADPYSDSLADRYLNRGGQPNPDPRFAKLILGYYGELKAYDGNGGVHQPQPEVIQFFESNNRLQLSAIERHPSHTVGGNDLREAQHSAWQLIQRLGTKALSFADFDQLTILYALKPAGAVQVDPIEQAVESYVERSERAKIDGSGSTFPDYEALMQPMLSHLSAMFVLRPDLEVKDIPLFPLEKLGKNLCSHLFDIYIDLPIWTSVTSLSNHLSKLLSSSHISPELLEAVRNVSMSLAKLDARPDRQDKDKLTKALDSFSKLTISDLLNSIALINSFINDIAKYGTNPKAYAGRSIGFEDMPWLTKTSGSYQATDPWESRIQQSITGKYLRLENDFQRRSENWKA